MTSEPTVNERTSTNIEKFSVAQQIEVAINAMRKPISSGSLIGVRKRTIESAPRRPRDIGNEFCRQMKIAVIATPSNGKARWTSEPVAFDPDCVSAVRGAAETLGCESMDIVSGAGHDAVYISRLAPTGMIFIPCRNGVSHHESEFASPEHCLAGTQVLAAALHELANR